jgi:sialic acid synthase SpsE
LTAQEQEYRNKATKSVVAIRNLKSGDTITQDSVSLKRSTKPITDNSILEIEQVIGKKLSIDIKINTPIMKGDL